jgi:hypothetical protein
MSVSFLPINNILKIIIKRKDLFGLTVLEVPVHDWAAPLLFGL